jgi:hypothetical protein
VLLSKPSVERACAAVEVAVTGTRMTMSRPRLVLDASQALESSTWAGTCFGAVVRKPTGSNRLCENGQSVVRSFEPLPHRPVALLNVLVEHYLAGKCIC